jgi:hypothetical protein
MSALSPFDYLNAITQTKQNLMEDPENIKGYSPFMVNRGLSYHYDTVLYANEMNLHSDLEKDQQFSYLINIIRARKRFAKWAKPQVNDDIKAVMEYFKYSLNHARAILPLLTSEQLKEIKKQQKVE